MAVLLSGASYVSQQREYNHRRENAHANHQIAQPTPSITNGEIHSNGQPQGGKNEDDSAPWIVRFFSDITVADAMIVLFTGWLAFSTVGLWKETRRLAEHGERQADDFRKSVEAASEQAKAAILQTRLLIEVERGNIVFFGTGRMGKDGYQRGGFQLWEVVPGAPNRRVKPSQLAKHVYFRLKISNTGKTQVNIRELAAKLVVRDRAPTEPFDSVGANERFEKNMTLAGMRRGWVTTKERPTMIKSAELEAIRNGDAKLYVCGTILYQTMTEFVREGFVYWWDEIGYDDKPPRGFQSVRHHWNRTHRTVKPEYAEALEKKQERSEKPGDHFKSPEDWRP